MGDAIASASVGGVPVKHFLSLIAAFVVFVGVALSSDTAAPLGLWVWADEEAPARVNLTLKKTRKGWSAEVNGTPVPVTIDAGQIILATEDNHSFVGELTNDGTVIEGYWEQPPTDTAYLTMRTPVRLEGAKQGGWSSTFDIQARPFRLFLDIFQDDDGEQRAVIRNPERNAIERATLFNVESNGERTWLLKSASRRRNTTREINLVSDDELTLNHSFFEEPVTLRPAVQEEALAYFPRPQKILSSAYRVPRDLADGWTIKSAEELGMDRGALDRLIADIAGDDPRNDRPRMIHAVSAAYKGQLFLDEYFYDHQAEDRHDTRSLAKVFGSMMVGALMHAGEDISPDDTPVPALLAKAGLPLGNPAKADITLAHLMTYSSGLDCNASSNSRGNEDSMWGQTEQPNFWLYTAQLDLVHRPGDRYAYCSGSINLVGAAIRKASGKSTYATFQELIGKPLGFGPYHWDLAPNGEGYLGGGVYVRPRDILKIGQVYADGGTWNGKRILSEAFVAEAIAPTIAISPETTGMTEEQFNNEYFGGQQGYTWRLDTISVGDRRHPSYEATGNGGQIVLVVPDFDLVVAFTGGNYRMGYVWGRWRNEIVGGHIIPAIEARLSE